MSDRREELPTGETLESYVDQILPMLPTGNLTHRETWALAQHIHLLQTQAECSEPITLEQAKRVIEEAGMVAVPVGGQELISLFWRANPGISCGSLNHYMAPTIAMIKTAQGDSHG